ncbi:MAG: response regulator [Pseudomonadota bacterium]
MISMSKNPVGQSWHGLRRLSLKTRVTLLTLAIFLLGIWSLALYLGRVLHQDLERLLGDQQFSTASYLADEVNHELSYRIALLTSIAKSIPAAALNDASSAQAYLAQHPLLSGVFNGGMLIIQSEGICIAEVSPGTGRVGVDYRDIDSVATALKEGKASIGRPVIGKKLGMPLIGMTVPIRDAQGKVIGALSGITNLGLPNFLDGVTATGNLQHGAYMLLVAPQYRMIVTSSDPQRVMEQLPAAGVNPAIDRFIEGYEGSAIVVNPAGVEVLAAAKRILIADWYIAVLLPTAEAFAPIRDMLQRMVLAALLLSLLAGGLTWWVLRRQFAPMDDAARRLTDIDATDQMLQPLPIVRKDEVGHLIAGFNHALAIAHEREATLRKFSQAMEQSPESIMIADLDSRIEYVNAAFLRISGYAAGEMIGQTPRLLHSGKTPQATYDALWQSLHRGDSWKGEFINRRKDGSEYVEFASITPLRQADGRITHYLAFKEDITEKKRMGQELDRHRHHLEVLVAERTAALDAANQELARQADIARSATQAKSAFLASMSHEIRTPMNAVIGLMHLAGRKATDARQRGHLLRADSAARHLLSIINDILDLSKIESGKLVITQSAFRLNDLIESIMVMIRDKTDEKGLSLTSKIDPGLPDVLVGDSLRIGQILLNYASNAVKFTTQGHVDIRVSLVRETGDELIMRCAVTDTGIGITPQVMATLFKPFQQADGATSHQYGGTGLGLAISRHLAELMGGEAGADSVPDQGSTFWFTVKCGRGQAQLLDCRDAGLSEDEVKALLKQHHVTAPILIVDDEPINRIVTHEVLSEVFPHIDMAEDGLQAVSHAATKRYHLILMDMQMPLMNGIDATRQIRQLPEHAETPIIAMTANAFAEDKAQCLEAGMNDFLAKPANPPDLLLAIHKWLSMGARP